jgi:hypothetical protein
MHIADVIGLLVQMDIRAANTSHSALLSRGSICRANLCSPSPAANAMPRSILFLSGRHRGAARISQSTNRLDTGGIHRAPRLHADPDRGDDALLRLAGAPRQAAE